MPSLHATQGPYVYKLYAEYGFSKGDIGLLFIAGFGSSLLFGTVVGGFADKYGRRLNCLLFALLYGLSCITKHFNNFTILMIGRLLGGIATSILYSAFETWMIHEHRSVCSMWGWDIEGGGYQSRTSTFLPFFASFPPFRRSPFSALI